MSTLLAGWLFADALLGITFVALASEATPEPRPEVTISPTPKPSPAPTTTPPPKPVGVEQRAVVVKIPAGIGTDQQLRSLFAAHITAGRRAAFALTFGTAPKPGPGVQLARTRNAQLLRVVPEVFQGSAQRSFWQAQNAANPRAGDASVEVYLFTTTSGS